MHHAHATEAQEATQQGRLACGLGVKLIEGLDGQQLLLALVGHHAVYLAPHNDVHVLGYAELAVPAQGRAWALPASCSSYTQAQDMPLYIDLAAPSQDSLHPALKPRRSAVTSCDCQPISMRPPALHDSGTMMRTSGICSRQDALVGHAGLVPGVAFLQERVGLRAGVALGVAHQHLHQAAPMRRL